MTLLLDGGPTTSPASPALSPTPERTGPSWHRFRVKNPEGWVAWTASLAIYLAAGFYLNGLGLIFGDALSRVGNGSDVLWSRQPHLAAIGFVWNPLPSLAEMPLTAARFWFPGWVGHGGPAIVVSAVFMAGSVAVVLGALRDMGASRLARYVLTAIFALDPYIWLYGANGMSEAMQLFFLLVAGRALARWLREPDRAGPLVRCGFALGAVYMTRYEGIAAGTGSCALVLLVSYLRQTGTWRERARPAAVDFTLIAAPFVASVTLWAVVAKVIVKSWFPTFTSQYGNKNQVANAASGIAQTVGGNIPQIASYLSKQMFALEPLALVVIALAALTAVRRRDRSPLAWIAALGCVLAFDSLATFAGSTFGWLRFNICLIPLTVLLAGTITVSAGTSRSRLVATTNNKAFGRTIVAAALLLPSIVTTYHVMLNPNLAREENGYVRYLATGKIDPDAHELIQKFAVQFQIAKDLDAMHLANGSVLTDVANSFTVVLDSRHPKNYVITPDLDFQRVAADPYVFHVKYALVGNTGAGFDAVEQQHPGIFANGGGIGTLVRSWPGTNPGDAPSWKLYRIDRSTGEG